MALTNETVALRYEDIVADVDISAALTVFEAKDVVVYYGKDALVAVQGLDYVLQLAGDFNTVTVTPTSSLIAKIDALIAADSSEENYITVRRAMDFLTEATAPLTRQTEFTSREFERAAMRDQQLDERMNRAFAMGPNIVGDAPKLDLTALSPGQALILNTEGTAIVPGPNADDIENAEAKADAAEVSKVAAEVAKVAAEAAAQGRNLLPDATVRHEAVTGDVQCNPDSPTFASQVTFAGLAFERMAALRAWHRRVSVGDQNEELDYEPDGASNRYQPREFLKDARKLGLPRHKEFEISGNHDGDDVATSAGPYGKTLETYRHAYGATAYRVEDGSILKVMIGDEAYSTAGVVSQRTLDWVDRVCTNAAVLDIEFYIHQPLANTTHNTDPVANATNVQENSTAILALAEKHKVAAIFHGHVSGDLTDTGVVSHFEHPYSYTDGDGAVQNKTIFTINCGMHLPSAFDGVGFPVSFVELERTVGSTTVVVRRYDLTNETYVAAKQTSYELRFPWVGEGSPRHDGRNYPDMDLLDYAPSFVSSLKREETSPGVWEVPVDHVHVALSSGASELNNDDVQSGLMVVHDLYMAGALSSDLLRDRKLAKREGVRRLSGTEQSYTSEYVLQLGYGTVDVWNLSDVFTVQPQSGIMKGAGAKMFMHPARSQVIDTRFVETQSVTTVSDETYADVTGMTIAHTAADASHINRLEFNVRNGGNLSAYSFFQVLKDGTPIGNVAASGNQPASRTGAVAHDSNFHMHDLCIVIEDVAGDTAAHTYKLQMRSWSTHNSHVNRSDNDSDNSYAGRGVSTIKLTERTP